MKKSQQERALNIVLIGAGNLATHLGERLHEKDVVVEQVFSRKKKPAQSLSKKLSCGYTTDLTKISAEADLYILAVSDGAIHEVANSLSKVKSLKEKLIVHTSGSTPSTILKPYFKKYGVFYPVQTFSKKRKVDFAKIPICVDARYARDRKVLKKIAGRISEKVFDVNDEQRAVIHVAAVFVNNFANHMFNIGEKLMEQNDLSFDLLRPLLLETALKVQEHSPWEMQTGPAARGDKDTIDRHKRYLEVEFPEFLAIYEVLTKGLFS